MNEMILIEYFDWEGTKDGLEEYILAAKECFDATPGAKFLGRHDPYSRKYHHAFFVEFKDWITFQEALNKYHYKIDKKTLTHAEWEFFK
ncbi:MAG: hypothetical protein NTY03_08715 [Candidatus Bathyarchaeota archaeon]|nr:hypothetical protein [Candidatus Bathyarchaeota archaeon]